MSKESYFESSILVLQEKTDLALQGIPEIAWDGFLLNPRRLRGSDFLMRWSQGVWSERRLTSALNNTGNFYAIPYGPSGTAPSGDVRAYELYFERLEAAGLDDMKRPDLLVFRIGDKQFVDDFVESVGGYEELQFIGEDTLQPLVSKAIIAIECENSLWVAEKMPDYGKEMRKQKRLHGQLGFAKNAVLPTIIIKEEDRIPLAKWQQTNGIPIHVWHSFYDRAFGLAFDDAEHLIAEGLTSPTEQVFQAPGGAITKKAIYKHYYHYAYPLAISISPPELVAAHIEDKNGHILPYVRFEGGMMEICNEASDVLDSLGGVR
ncbi:MAG: AccI family restriction endonuclease [Cellulomonadaceae bacterium]|jgi:hypothetical protein|nr:AccI family restriction endonuclease [Cellulomonadaceae bacterium]